MRVALFFDGKNFHSSWKQAASGQPLDFVELSRWLLAQVGGSSLAGAYYYTGIEADAPRGSGKLESFLGGLERQPGFFVKRLPRKMRTSHCVSCGAEHHYTEEKEVDTTMVADMLRLAAAGAFDACVLLSGDADFRPAVEAVRILGPQAYVATWGGLGLSSRLREVAFEHIDLATGLSRFLSLSGLAAAEAQPVDPALENGLGAPADAEVLFLEELAKAEQQFAAGYVGANYFVTRWQSERLAPSALVRRHIMTRLEEAGQIEIYETAGGEKAVRRK